jgi:hypothetical protein
VTVPVAAWQRPAFRATGRRAMVMLLAFADDNASGAAPELRLAGSVPKTAPTDALEIRLLRYADSSGWIDGWRTGAFRNIASQQMGDLASLDAASCCYSIRIEVDDPTDLAYLQLAWAVAASLARAGSCAVLDVYAATWRSGAAVASLSPDRPFTVQREVSVIHETEPTAQFGYPVHTRGMIKFGRPDLIAGVSADRIEETGRILNHLARMLAEGDMLVPGQRLRFDGRRTVLVTPYTPDATTPEVNLANDGLLLVDV